MPNVSKVRPKIWNDETVIDLFDDGSYSAIWGVRKDENVEERSLGVRWNGNGGHPGYPNQGKNPVWYSEPQFLAKPILHGLLNRVLAAKDLPRREEFIQNILAAIEEC
jgi:hypothetical protein